MTMNYVPATNFCTQDQIANLHKLLSFLKSNVSKTQFDMTFFSWSDPSSTLLGPYEVKNECGTTCCLAGHGPLAGIEASLVEDWEDYVDRVFTDNLNAFKFLFAAEWDCHQPAKEQAIFRLELFLKKGLPEAFTEGKGSYVTPILVFTNECRHELHSFDQG